eukprot:scaffold10348_cov54-Attheya_sp.AAC.2
MMRSTVGICRQSRGATQASHGSFSIARSSAASRKIVIPAPIQSCHVSTLTPHALRNQFVMKRGINKLRQFDRSNTRTRIPAMCFSSGTWQCTSIYLRNLVQTKHSIRCPQEEKESSLILACSSVFVKEDVKLVQRIKRLAKKLWDAFLVALRTAEIGVCISPLLVLTPAAMLSAYASSRYLTDGDASQETENKSKNVVSNAAWWYALNAIQVLGPAFVKLSQWAATRRDLFSPQVCDRLSLLQDGAYLHSWNYSHKSLVKAFGADYREKGLEIHPGDLIGSGSAAQVYRGTLTLKNGWKKNVAVKILHPNIKKRVERDLLLMERVSELLDSIPSETIHMMSLPRVADTFGSIIRRQVDLRIEGHNLNQFHSNFVNGSKGMEDDGEVKTERIPKVSFPRPIKGWVDEHVLVEDLVDNATPIAQFLRDSSEKGLELRRELAGPLLRSFLKMVFLDNFVHGDLHAGNVMVQTQVVMKKRSFLDSFLAWWEGDADLFYNMESKAERNHTIVFLDAGIATSLSPTDQRNLRDLFRAIIFNNGNQAGRFMVERAKYERCSQVEGGVDAFAKGIEDIVSEFHDRRKKGLTLGAVRIGSLLSQVLDLCRIHRVEIDPAMAGIVISTLVLEGLGRSLQPELNLIDCALPFVMGGGKV